MAGRLSFVPKFGEWDNRDPARSRLGRTSPPPRNLYRDLIRSVAVSGGQYIRHPIHAGSSYSPSGASNSHFYPSNNSDCSSCSASGAARADFCAHDHELTKIARRMVGDGYARRMVNAFDSGGPDRAALETWFLELDVDWVLQISEENYDLRQQLQDKAASSSLQELVERWIRAVTVIAVSVTELVVTVDDETPTVARFGRASMAKMLVFVDAIIPALKEEKLQALVDMYMCVRSASYRFTPLLISSEAQTILNEIGASLSREVIRLREAIFSTMEEVRTLVEDDDLWAIEIPRGRGEVHRNTRFMVDCIMSMVKAGGSTRTSAQSHDDANFGGLVADSVNYLKDLLLRKSKICSAPSLRYLFLLNNYYLVAQLSERWPGDHWGLAPECTKFMDSYLDVSWGHVLSHIPKTGFMDSCCLDVSCGCVWFCIPKTGIHGSRQNRKQTSSLAKFESAFHKTYQAQKFWKVQDPQLRDALRRAIAGRVVEGYRYYLQKHPALENQVSSRGSSPDVLNQMLGELFEG
ncbi:hypothetical protein ACQ4PT_005331 [Festuca glaucescens]